MSALGRAFSPGLWRVCAAAALAGLLLTACATSQFGGGSLGGAQPGLSVHERLSLAVALLDRGHRDQARAELSALLAASPGDGEAAQLLREIDEDPQAAFGPQSFAYTVRQGETMSMIAARFLGDPLRFYILARYNGLDAPADLRAGDVLRIPGVPRKLQAPRMVTAPPAAPVRPATAIAAPPPTTEPSPPPVNAARARSLRAAGLEAMDRGQINRAVGLLTQAAQVDPQNPLIKRDLSRAQRVQATVNGR